MLILYLESREPTSRTYEPSVFRPGKWEEGALAAARPPHGACESTQQAVSAETASSLQRKYLGRVWRRLWATRWEKPVS